MSAVPAKTVGGEADNDAALTFFIAIELSLITTGR
jgi:hypothetical protein